MELTISMANIKIPSLYSFRKIEKVAPISNMYINGSQNCFRNIRTILSLLMFGSLFKPNFFSRDSYPEELKPLFSSELNFFIKSPRKKPYIH